jgi:uncharacterized membrane protein YoaK (UPF0700 family)
MRWTTAGYAQAEIPDDDQKSASEPPAAPAAMLAALASVAGYLDAVTYLSLGNVFTANMTGNTVLLAIAVSEGDGARAARSLCAIAGFCAGAAVSALVLRPPGEKRAWPVHARLVLAVETTSLLALALLGALLADSTALKYPLITISGLAMGAQSSLVWLARSSGAATTYITGTLTGMIVRAVQRRHPDDEKRVAVAGRVWLTYLAAALIGAAAERAWRTSAVFVVGAALAALAIALRGEGARGS